ncbi:hypothetical protein C2E23DRAFT_729753 [Lenzites betulinus]|nr:hypothetical protein C2E23DRAFT_729753 [Lenzites betulinus]
MRQRGLSDEDIRFRQALENLRYCSCTKDDVELLLSRVCRPGLGSTLLNDPLLRSVSIITARNAHRDSINALRVEEFARLRGTPLVSFVSIDTWAKTKDSSSVRRAQRQFREVVDPMRASNNIGPRMQDILWRLPPTLTDHHAGTLSLCKGMPILLKYNEATELCATNGAEAIVVDWRSHVLPNKNNVLDVLFVELVNPPRPLQLPGLPPNVIPLTRTKKTVRCTLPIDDMQVSVSRDQVMVLPNFAMTDFASQGRTRTVNVVHLKYCKNHQSIYTCLSRSSSLLGTVILDNFDTVKIRGGASSALRREFRELEILDDITRLRTENTLPSHVRGSTREPLIASYQAWKGNRYVPTHVHPAIDWRNMSNEELTPEPYTESATAALLSVSATQTASTSTTALPPDASVPRAAKRPRVAEQWDACPTKRIKDSSAYDTDARPASIASSNIVHRHGITWDSFNWSCAYDSLLTILVNIYIDMDSEQFDLIATGNRYMDFLRARLPACLTDAEELTSMRDVLRDLLYAAHPTTFPRTGRVMTAVSDIMACLFDSPTNFGESAMLCSFCATNSPHMIDVARSYAWSLTPAAFRHCFPGQSSITSSEYIACLLSAGVTAHCPACRTINPVRTVLTQPPPLVILETSDAVPVRPEAQIRLPVNESVHVWRFAGAIYHGFAHFTARYVDTDGRTWYHDGDVTKQLCIPDADILTNSVAAGNARARSACHYIYALSH